MTAGRAGRAGRAVYATSDAGLGGSDEGWVVIEDTPQSLGVGSAHALKNWRIKYNYCTIFRQTGGTVTGQFGRHLLAAPLLSARATY